MFSNSFGKHDHVECGLVRLLKNLVVTTDSSSDSESSDESGSDVEVQHSSKCSKFAPVPLQSVHVVASVIHAVAEVELTQVFVNKENDPIEAIYYFPVDSNGGVTHFQAELEGRVITGIVKPQEEAKEQYAKAIKEKQTAFLVESNKPDIFKVKVGFLKPGAQVKIIIRYVTEVKNEKGTNAIRFFIPTTIAPRYVPPSDTGLKTRDIKDMVFSMDSPATLKLTVNVAITGKIKSIESPSHTITTTVQKATLGTWSHCVVNLSTSLITEMNRDFVLLIQPEDTHVPRLYYEKLESSTALMAHLIPSFNLDEQKVEMIFVLDRSGSMSGASIGLAKQALELFMHSLPVDCYFNIVGFGSSFEMLFKRGSVKYSHQTMKTALNHAKSLRADMGGTEILEPLESIFSKSAIRGYLRQIFVLTDGEVSNTDDVIGICHANASNSRVFALGIGAAASHHLVEGIAHAGGGTSVFLTHNEPMDSKILQQLKNAIQPSLTDVSLKWIGSGCTEFTLTSTSPPVEINRQKTLLGYGKPVKGSPVSNIAQNSFTQVPEKIPPIFDGSQLLVFGLFSADVPNGVEISAESPDGPLSIRINLCEENAFPDATMMHKLAAIKTIHDLEMKETELRFKNRREKKEQLADIRKQIIVIACKHGLTSKYTSFVAIDSGNDSKVDESWVMQSRHVPSQFAQGWHGGPIRPRTGCAMPVRSSHSSSRSMQVSRKGYFGGDRDIPPRKQLNVKAARKSAPSTGAVHPPSSEDDGSESEESVIDGDEFEEGFDSVAKRPKLGSVQDKNTGEKPGPAAPRDVLHGIVATQTFDGSFALNKEFSAALGVGLLEKVLQECKKGGWTESVWATALAVSYMREKLADLKESWELVEMKSVKWLNKNCGGQDLSTIFAAAKVFLAAY